MTLVLDRVSRTVGDEVHLAEIDLVFEPGSLNILLGPTLAGKTTLMRVIAGLDRPTSGRLRVDDRDVTGVSVRRRSVAMVYQQFINYPSFTVYDNIASPLRQHGLARAEIDRKVREAAAMMRIDDLLARLPAQLSGGQQQRTAIARALVRDADLLLLDEPLVNLDYKLREELRVELQTIFRGRRSIVVYATTEPLEALMLGGSTVVLDVGRILQAGPTIEVYHRPATTRVGAVFSDPPMNLIDGEVTGGEAVMGTDIRFRLDGHLTGLAPGRYRFGVRANHLTVTATSDDDLRIAATVDLAEISGSETFVHARHNAVSWIVQEQGVHSFRLGESIEVFLSPRRVFAFDESGRLVAAPEPSATATG